MTIKLGYTVVVPMDTAQYRNMLDKLMDIDTCFYFDGEQLVFDPLFDKEAAEILENTIIGWL